MPDAADKLDKNFRLITLFMCGDVMTGRGIDQVLPHPCDPILYEPYVKDAREYVRLAERVNGPIQQPVDFSYIWGDALAELDRAAPDLRLINLETSLTKAPDYWKDKGINYRMHPDNTPCLTAAQIDCCALANNHVLDWGYSGLAETLQTLQKADIKSAGAGCGIQEVEAPAVMEVAGKGRVLVFSFGSESSGIPWSWAALEDRPGVNRLNDFSDETIQSIKQKIQGMKRPGDVVVASIHWGGNWGYGIPFEQALFAHQLIDEAAVDIIHGHSSHHVKGIEIYREKLILYGCGDFLNDYEGISGYESFRDDLTLMYFAAVDPSAGQLIRLRMTPLQIKRFALQRVSRKDAVWLKETLNREGKKLGTQVELQGDNTLSLRWKSGCRA